MMLVITSLHRTGTAAAAASTLALSRYPAAATATTCPSMLSSLWRQHRQQQQQQQRRGYHEIIIEHYENPRNVGSFDKNDEDVGTVSLLIAPVLSLTAPLLNTTQFSRDFVDCAFCMAGRARKTGWRKHTRPSSYCICCSHLNNLPC